MLMRCSSIGFDSAASRRRTRAREISHVPSELWPQSQRLKPRRELRRVERVVRELSAFGLQRIAARNCRAVQREQTPAPFGYLCARLPILTRANKWHGRPRETLVQRQCCEELSIRRNELRSLHHRTRRAFQPRYP